MSDLISRLIYLDDAIESIEEERFPIDSDYAEGFMAAIDKVEWILKEWLPSAERKTGRWIKTEGLDEEIRCTMCTNHMRSDRGCDGYCQYDEKLYKQIMSIIEDRIDGGGV